MMTDEDFEFQQLELRQERQAANRDAGMRGLIKEELAAPEQEPVAYMLGDDDFADTRVTARPITDADRYAFLKTMHNKKRDRILYANPELWDAIIDNAMKEQKP